MSYFNDGPPWGLIQVKRKVKELRIELVKIGEEVLQEIEKGKVPSEDVIKRFRNFVEKAKSAGISES